MKKSFSLALSAAVSISVLLLYQNCGGTKFQSSSGLDQSSSIGDPIDHSLIDHGVSLAAFKNSNQVSDALPLAVNTAYEVKALGDSLNPVSANWSARSGVAGFANCSLAGTDLLTRSLNCSSVGMAHVEVTLGFADGPAVTKVFERQVADSGTTLPPSNIVTFNIPPGTGNKPWNTSATAVVVFRGQTLQITNQDTTVHRLHSGGRPCPHQPGNMATGQSYNCVISSAHLPTATDNYDHNVGNSAVFYINAIDGAALYNTTKFNIGGMQRGCVDCHGALATSAVKNASLAMIKANISANSGGMGAITLSDDQLRAIVYELSK